VIAGAVVTLHSLDENFERQTTTDDSGNFVVDNLKAGRYKLTAHHDGLSDAVVGSVTLEARQELRIPITLQIATASTVVEVSDTAVQINTENGTISDSIPNQEITELPLNNRATTTSPLGALALSPDVQQDSAGNIALSGASSSMVNFSVDGISTANVRQNGALQDAYPSQEGISAVKVTSFNNSAEFSQVGDVTFTTKSGTNHYHGSLFEYLQNDAFDAAPYGFSGKAPKHFNTFGGALGGPLSIPHLFNGKDRTFFFLDYEGNRRSTAVAQQFLVPTQDERNGNLSAIGGSMIPSGSINATAKALLNYYPLPNVSGQANYNYENFQSTPARTDGADLRIDQAITAQQSVHARFSRKNITADYANPLLPNDSDSVHNRSLLVSHTWVITPRLVNEFRFGFTNATTSVGFPIQGADALSQLDLTGVNISQHPASHAFPTFNFSAGTGFTPIGRDKTGVTQSKTTQFTDNLSWTRGKHTFKTGIDARRVRYSDIETFLPSDDFGQFTFADSTSQPIFTGNSFGDFLEGLPTNIFFAVSSPDVAGTAWEYSLFGQDEFQVTSRLTLSYGLRWTILPGFHEDGGNLANFDQRNNSIVVPDNLAAYLQNQNLQASNLAFQQSLNACGLGYAALPCSNYVTASHDHLPQSLRNTYMRNFQPRFALAFRPFNDTKTVIRAGFGVFTVTNLGPLSFNNSGNPTSALHTYANALSNGQPLIQFPNTAPASAGVQYGGGSLDQGVDPNYRDPQANQWNFTVERQLASSDSLRVSYVGMHTYRLSITEDLNQIPASTTPYQTTASSPYVDPRAPYHNWFELYSTFNAGEANYNALEIDESHKTSHGLYFDANYTLAKNLADNQGDTPAAFAGEVNYGVPIADRFHIHNDYGNVEGARRHRFLLTGVYQLPVGVGRSFVNGGGWKNAVLGGWEMTNVTVIESGPWLTPSISASADQSNTDVVNRGAYLRPDQIATNFYQEQSRAHYFNLAAFSPTPAGAGRFGNAGVGILEGPGTVTASLGMAKVFQATERVKVRFESTFTNVFNHTNFAPPATQIDNPQFGILSAPQTAENAGNRTGQFALRVEF
jgi:Carboxypeptidase regulatory-like domain